MGQTQSESSVSTGLFIRKSHDYDSIPARKTKILAIFSHSIEVVEWIIPKIVSALSELYEITTATYSPAGLSLRSTKYLSLKQTLDNVEHVVFFSVSHFPTSKWNAFAAGECFATFLKYIQSRYSGYRRYGYFVLGIMTEDFVGPENLPLTLIYDGDCVEIKNTGTPPNIKSILADAYKDTDHASEFEDYWWVRSFTAKFTPNRLYFGGEWVDEDILIAQIKKNLGEIQMNPL